MPLHVLGHRVARWLGWSRPAPPPTPPPAPYPDALRLRQSVLQDAWDAAELLRDHYECAHTALSMHPDAPRAAHAGRMLAELVQLQADLRALMPYPPTSTP